MDPANLKYAKSHEWVHVEGDTATVGISDFAVKELTDLVFIELPEVGAQLSAGDTFGEVESVKAVSDLYAPVGGEVIEINDSLPDNLGLLSDSPYDDGWMIKIKLAGDTPLDGLMDQAGYDAHCRAEEQ